MRERVLVLGAGIQGVCAALILKNAGYAVTLIDRAPAPLLRAGLRNEGKIHLGFIYVNDPTFETPLLMLRSALAFASTVEECVGARINWDACVSRAFSYVIARDSMVPLDDLLERYERLCLAYMDCMRDDRVTYLGRRPARLWRRASSAYLGRLLAETAAGAVETAEVALDLRELRRILCVPLERGVDTLFGHSVDSAVRTPWGFRVGGVSAQGQAWQRDAAIVVNCLWDGRLKLDRELGFAPARQWVYRLKYRLLGTLPPELERLPSLSVVLGPYGDLVVYPRNRIYLSWYPACMRGWSTDVAPPQAWDAPCDGRVDSDVASLLRRQALDGFAQLVPGLEKAAIDTIDAGVIFSWGETDIDHPSSELHRRSAVGITQHEGYFSVDPGKLTCAPFFARQLRSLVKDT